MALSSSGSATLSQVTVGGTAVSLVDATPVRRSVLIQNVHATNNLFIGPTNGVLTTTGIQVRSNESIELTDYNGALFGIASAASTDVRILEVGT